jgi:16S rRNA processing protein RimM
LLPVTEPEIRADAAQLPADAAAVLAPPSYLEVARVASSYGVKGEVRAHVITDFPQRFGRLKTVYLGAEPRAYPLEGWRALGREVVLKLGGVDTPERAQGLAGQTVLVPAAQAVKLPKGMYYHYQVLGLDVMALDGKCLGKVIEILPTGANDVYVVHGPDGEYLIPAVADVVRQVNLKAGCMLVALLEGMEATPLRPSASAKPKRVRPTVKPSVKPAAPDGMRVHSAAKQVPPVP